MSRWLIFARSHNMHTQKCLSDLEGKSDEVPQFSLADH